MSMRLVTRQLPRLAQPTTTRTFSALSRRMAEGDSKGTAQGDAFTKREQASEDYYVRQQEKEKLAQLKKKIADQEAALAKDRDEAEAMSKKQ